MANKAIVTKLAPGAIGPYSQAIKAGDTIYVSGQLGLNPSTGSFDKDDIVTQTTQSLKNIENILQSEGYSLDDVCKTTVFLKDINEFTKMNEVYGTFFKEPYPARAAFEVKALPKDARVEIEAIAYKNQ